MKEQYVGDINDYRKYALLRALADGGRNRIGVCWMLTPPDGRADGGKIDYLEDRGRYRGHDPELFDLLAKLVGQTGPKRLRAIEKSGIIPKAIYFNEYLADHAGMRRAYFEVALEAMAKADLIFFDPDNGLDVASTPKGKTGSSKFIFRDEIATTFAAGHSVMIYQHFPHKKRDSFLQIIGKDLKAIAPGSELWAARTAHVAFILAIQQKHKAALESALTKAAERWGAEFMTIGRLSTI
jgi:hypothetical protein